MHHKEKNSEFNKEYVTIEKIDKYGEECFKESHSISLYTTVLDL